VFIGGTSDIEGLATYKHKELEYQFLSQLIHIEYMDSFETHQSIDMIGTIDGRELNPCSRFKRGW
jgi:hypothetical protein